MFSVVIPLYNKEAFIADTVQSVLRQRFAPFELLVVDDGSSDRSPQIVRDIDDPRIRLIQQANAGVGAARNRGIEEAKYDWVAFLDADDLWSCDHLDALASIIERAPEAKFVSTQCCFVGDEDRSYLREAADPANMDVELRDFFTLGSVEASFFHTSAIAASRDALLTVGGFGQFQPGQDVELWARLSLSYQAAIGRLITDYRRHDPAGITAGAKIRVETADIGPGNLPTPVLSLLDKTLRQGGLGDRRRAVEEYYDARLLVGILAAARRKDPLRVWKLFRLLRRKSPVVLANTFATRLGNRTLSTKR